jgi:hypothetical protein
LGFAAIPVSLVPYSFLGCATPNLKAPVLLSFSKFFLSFQFLGDDVLPPGAYSASCSNVQTNGSQSVKGEREAQNY